MDFNAILQGIKKAILPEFDPGVPVVSAREKLPDGYSPQTRAKLNAENNAFLSKWNARQGAQQPAQPIARPPQATPTPMPQRLPAKPVMGQKRVIPGGTDLAMNYIRKQTPGGQAPEEYYPALKDPEFMRKVNEADKVRQGVANLLLSQGFMESTLGRNSSNVFGAKPGGQVSSFSSPSESLDYQLSENVLGGGANPNMNILNEGDNSPLTFDRILQLYKSYDPPGAYVDNLRDIFGE